MRSNECLLFIWYVIEFPQGNKWKHLTEHWVIATSKVCFVAKSFTFNSIWGKNVPVNSEDEKKSIKFFLTWSESAVSLPSLCSFSESTGLKLSLFLMLEFSSKFNFSSPAPNLRRNSWSCSADLSSLIFESINYCTVHRLSLFTFYRLLRCLAIIL